MPLLLPPELVARARATICKGHDHSDHMVAVCADLYLTRGMPRRDVLPLQPGYSIPLEAFEQMFCKPRHSEAPHDILACCQTAYYERLERDRAKLARLAAQRGQ